MLKGNEGEVGDIPEDIKLRVPIDSLWTYYRDKQRYRVIGYVVLQNEEGDSLLGVSYVPEGRTFPQTATPFDAWKQEVFDEDRHIVPRFSRVQTEEDTL